MLKLCPDRSHEKCCLSFTKNFRKFRYGIFVREERVPFEIFPEELTNRFEVEKYQRGNNKSAMVNIGKE